MVNIEIDIGKIEGLILTLGNVNMEIVEKMKNEFEKIPKHWRERLRKDKWKYLLVDAYTIEKYEIYVEKYKNESGNRTIILNLDEFEENKNLLLKEFYLYISKIYGRVELSSEFKESYEIEKERILKLLNLEASVEIEEVAKELFAFQINNPEIEENSKCYLYMKKVIDGSIFCINTFKVPDYIYVGSGVMQYQLDVLLNQIKLLPKQYLEGFIECEWKIILTNESEWKLNDGKRNKIAYIIPELFEIYINSVTLEEKDSIFHEFGHYIHLKEQAKRKYKKEFKEIYEYEKIIFLKIDCLEYCIKDEKEYFAQAIRHYIICSETLKKYAPRTYQYIDDMMDEKLEELSVIKQLEAFYNENGNED